MSEQGLKHHDLTSRILVPLGHTQDALTRVEDEVGFEAELVRQPLLVLVVYHKVRDEVDANLRLLLVLPNPNSGVDGQKDRLI
jgi:hypothetical protein